MPFEDKGYEDILELLSMAEYEVDRKGYDNDFVSSVRKQYTENHRLSEKQIRALENIAKDSINRKLEMQNNLKMF